MILAAVFLLSLISPIHCVLYTNLDEVLGAEYVFLDHQTSFILPSTNSSIYTTDFTEILVWDADTIFVGATNYLLKLDANLTVQANFNVTLTTPCTRRLNILLDSCDNYFRVLLNISNNLYTCYTNRANPVCRALNTTNLQSTASPQFFQQVDETSGGFISPTLPLQLYQRNFAIFIEETVATSRLVTGSIFNSNELNRITVINPFSLTYISTTFYIPNRVAEVKKFLDVASFARTAHNYLDGVNRYIYFMFYEPSDSKISGVAKSRVARFCLGGPTDLNPDVATTGELPQIETFIKVELTCGEAFPSLVQDWLFVRMGSDFHYYAIFSSLDKGPNASYLCIYSLNTISTAMNAIKRCNVQSMLVLSSSIGPIAGTPTLGHVGALFTQIQRYPFTFNGTLYDIVYISLTNGSIIKYCISCPTEYPQVAMLQVVPTRLLNGTLSSIDRLQLHTDYLLAGGYTGLYRVPLQTCETFGDQYLLCLRDPMCHFDLASVTCMPVSNNGILIPSMIHFSEFLFQALPTPPSCSRLEGTINVNTNQLLYSWTCDADAVRIRLVLSDGKDYEFIHSSGSGQNHVDGIDFNLNERDVERFYIRPCFNYKSFQCSIPGSLLASNIIYEFNECNPLPLICNRPVCENFTTCNDRCFRVNIVCTISSVACSDRFTYNITSADTTTSYGISDISQISVNYPQCGSDGCLFQTFSHNDTLGVSTPGSSYWLHLLPRFSTFAPVITVYHNPVVNVPLSFNARFLHFSTHSCLVPTINQWPPSSPYNINQCVTTIMANGSIGQEVSRTGELRVEFSQQDRPPTSVGLSMPFKAINDDCSYRSDVMVTWQHPSYRVPSDTSAYPYLVHGLACNTDFSGGAWANGSTSYVCMDAILSYNVNYTIYVTSYEPCFARVHAFNSTTSMSVSGDPGPPQGLGYEFTGNNVTISWGSPLCVNSDAPLRYMITLSKSCTAASSEQSQNITGTSIQFELTSTNGSFRYTVEVRAMSVYGVSQSNQLAFTYPEDDLGGVCQLCTIRTVSIRSFPLITWTTTPFCAGLNISEFKISLYVRTSSSPLLANYVSQDTIPANGSSRMVMADAFQAYLRSAEVIPHRISIELNIQQRSESICSQCTSQERHAFLDNIYSTRNTRSIRAVSNSSQVQPVVNTCQDNKAYIILGLAGLAILCAIGNIGFMIISFCVFCIPRRKVFC